MSGPYKIEGVNQIYQLLFCDDIELYRSASTASGVYPWDVLFEDDPDTDRLREVLYNTSLETRPKILAARLLTENGVVEPLRRVMGVVVERRGFRMGWTSWPPMRTEARAISTSRER